MTIFICSSVLITCGSKSCDQKTIESISSCGLRFPMRDFAMQLPMWIVDGSLNVLNASKNRVDGGEVWAHGFLSSTCEV